MVSFRIFVCLLVYLVGISGDAYAGEVEQFEYDALGRLVAIFEGDTQISRYCYDSAGNRNKTLKGGSCPLEGEEIQDVEILPAPANLRWGSNQGGLYVDWNDVSGANYYELKVGGVVEVNSSSYTSSSIVRPDWVAACNAQGCGSKGYFK